MDLRPSADLTYYASVPSNGGIMGFGVMLKTMRESAGLSQSALAKRAGVPVRSIQNWEQGHRIPRIDTLPKLAQALGVPVGTLAAGIVEEKLGAAPEPPPAGPRKAKGGKPKGGK
jgi:transcriptional regulator with XRE-family HTH domain